MFKSYCPCCGRCTGEFHTEVARDLNSGKCVDCRKDEIDQVLRFVNPERWG